MPTALIVAAIIWATCTSAWFAFHPTTREQGGDLAIDSSGEVVRERDKVTLPDKHGAFVFPLLLVPIGLAAVPLVRRSTTATTACGAILTALALITALFSVGAYYIPSALLLLVSAAVIEFGLADP
ncbi:MAG: hypothetical protein ACR2FZ_00375 [Thermoleophilaceae bacterium]